MSNLTLGDLETYIEKLVALQMGDAPYSIDWADNIVRTPAGDWGIRIPEYALKDIRLVEL